MGFFGVGFFLVSVSQLISSMNMRNRVLLKENHSHDASACADNPLFRYGNDTKKDCGWVSENTNARCNRLWQKQSIATVWCPRSCSLDGNCTFTEKQLRKAHKANFDEEHEKNFKFNITNANIRTISEVGTGLHIDQRNNGNKPLAFNPTRFDTDKKSNKQTSNKDRNKESNNNSNDKCPSVIRKKVGLMDDSSGDFDDTVLLVSSNYAYYNFLQNWEYLASQLDLRWAVLALDEKLYNVLGPDRAVPPQANYSVSGGHGYRENLFQKITCNKMRMVLEIAKNCEVNVVFTDVDNVFFQNPFDHDLGRLIASKRYSYIYQPNIPVKRPREHWCMMRGSPDKESNTGFYYIKHNSPIYESIVDKTLERCGEPDNEIDDQTLFWQEFWKVENSRKGEFHHCKFDEYQDPTAVAETKGSANATFHWCCMDPYYYPIGKHDRRGGPSNRDPVTYHANFASSYGRKVQKLIFVRKDGYGWQKSRFEDGEGGLLDIPEIESNINRNNTCKDDRSFRNEDGKNCKYIGKRREEILIKLCSKDDVRAACQHVCDSCGTEAET